MNIKWLKFFFGLFLAIGIGLGGGAIYQFIKTSRFLERAVSQEGQVIDILWKRSSDDEYAYPKVEFEYKGQTHIFLGSFGSDPPSYEPGERVEVILDPRNVASARIKGGVWLETIIFGIMGVLFMAGGGIPLFLFERMTNRKNWLLSHGKSIYATIEAVFPNEAIEINGKNPWKIKCRGINPMTGQSCEFVSHNLFFDVTNDFAPGDQIEVLIHPQKPDKYYVLVEGRDPPSVQAA